MLEPNMYCACEEKGTVDLQGYIAIWEKEDTGGCFHSTVWKIFYSCLLLQGHQTSFLGDLHYDAYFSATELLILYSSSRMSLKRMRYKKTKQDSIGINI